MTGGGSKSVSGATYNPLTGVLVLTSAGHGLDTSNTITIGVNKLSFTCDADNHATSHTYPRVGDPAHNTALTISAFTSDTITVNVGAVKGVDSIKVGPNWHAGNALTPSAILYDPTSGVTTVTSAGHGLNNSNSVGIVTSLSLIHI